MPNLSVANPVIDVTGYSGTLTSNHAFGYDYAAAVNASNLAARHAIIFMPDSGSDAADLSIVVDANGVAPSQSVGMVLQ
jgi:hypothetical protein